MNLEHFVIKRSYWIPIRQLLTIEQMLYINMELPFIAFAVHKQTLTGTFAISFLKVKKKN